MTTTEFDRVWQKILNHEGDLFHTITGLDFVYRIQGDVLNTNRTRYNLSKGNFQAAFDMMPLSSPGQMSRKIRGSSYVCAILNDPRINGDSN